VTTAPSMSPVKSPRWHFIALLVASLQCVIWGFFIILWPQRSSVAYGFAKPPTDLFLWQGTGLIVLLFGIGYGLASTNPRQHWGLVLVGFLSKILGPLGMSWAVLQNDAPARVLLLLPINDVVWWIPFAMILTDALRARPVAAA
jgi:small multidrug resistance pump